MRNVAYSVRSISRRGNRAGCRGRDFNILISSSNFSNDPDLSDKSSLFTILQAYCSPRAFVASRTVENPPLPRTLPSVYPRMTAPGPSGVGADEEGLTEEVDENLERNAEAGENADEVDEAVGDGGTGAEMGRGAVVDVTGVETTL
jgi:hypothetical protein